MFVNTLFLLTTKKHERSALLLLCEVDPPVTGGFPHKGTAMRKMFPFDDVITGHWSHVRILTQFSELFEQQCIIWHIFESFCASKCAKCLSDIVPTVELLRYHRIVNHPVWGFRDSVGFYDLLDIVIYSSEFYWKNILNFHSNSTELSSLVFNCQHVTIGPGNGLATNTRQAITRTNLTYAPPLWNNLLNYSNFSVPGPPDYQNLDPGRNECNNRNLQQ